MRIAMTTSLVEGSRILGHGAIHLNSIAGGGGMLAHL